MTMPPIDDLLDGMDLGRNRRVAGQLLESAFALCLGCVVFNRLMRWGVIPETVCVECADISRRLAAATS